jgi:hypothetical protein
MTHTLEFYTQREMVSCILRFQLLILEEFRAYGKRFLQNWLAMGAELYYTQKFVRYGGTNRGSPVRGVIARARTVKFVDRNNT